MTTQLIAERSTVSLRDRALREFEERERENAVYQEKVLREAVADHEERLRIFVRDVLGIEGISIETRVYDESFVDARASVDGLSFSMRENYSEHVRLHVLVECSEGCGKELWLEIDGIQSLGYALGCARRHNRPCVEPEPSPPKPSVHDRIENALAAIIETGEQCGLAHDRVTDLLLQHPDVKSNAIAAMIGTPDPLKGENGKHSAASAEKVVEQNADYLAFRQLQRAAEVERWRALAKFKAADLRAKYEILKYDRAEGE